MPFRTSGLTGINNIYGALGYSDYSNERPKFSKMLDKFEEVGAIAINWANKRNAVQLLDSLDSIAVDEEEYIKMEKIISENNFQLPSITINLIEYYGREKAKEFFPEYSVMANIGKDARYDLRLHSDEFYFKNLIFEFKLRRNYALPDSKLLLQTFNLFGGEDKLSDNELSYIFLIVFTEDNFQSFEKLKFQFNQVLEEFTDFEQYWKRIRYVPVSLSGLHLINLDFEEFRKEYIENNIKFPFTSQVAPRDFPERNDHFFGETYIFKQFDFTIQIKPINTPFWRFGFKFSKNTEFPALTEGRHGNENYGDIHLSIGEIIDSDRMWGLPNQLSLNHYHIEQADKNILLLSNYLGEEVTFSMQTNETGAVTTFQTYISGKLKDERIFDISKYSFCRLFAWSEYNNFKLDTTMKVTRKKL